MLGWAGSLLLAFCAIPQAFKSVIEGHSNGISSLFIWMWTLGELFILIYIWDTGDRPLIFNYSSNLIFCLIILYYKLIPRR